MTTTHDERCGECKVRVGQLLGRAYGEVLVNHRVARMGTRPEDYGTSGYYGALSAIYRSLQGYRGQPDFVRARTLRACDFFIPDPGFIVEFDETQHFTLARRLALSLYPRDMKLGFDKARWMALCKRIGARDNHPLYRDEQRAWCDTLRDFAPALLGMRQTLRLHSRDLVWCAMSPTDEAALLTFTQALTTIRSKQ
jgi:hypothetical protein